MKRKISLLLVMLLAFTMIISTAAVSVSAETTYTPIGGSTTFVKNLVVDEDANIPNVTFTLALARGSAVQATENTIQILRSTIGGGTITPVEFTNDDTANTIPGLPTDSDPTTPTAGKKYAQKAVTVTFANNSFDKPGVYRYEIEEEKNNDLHGIVYDTNAIRYLDVFVVADENNVLSIESCVLRDNASTIGTDLQYTTDPDVKSAGFTNSITQYDLDFSKTIAGNQGDKNKRFEFTLKIEKANPGVYTVVTNDVTGNPQTINVPNTGEVIASYSLTNGSTVQVVGLNADAVCTISENAVDYTASYIIDSNGSVVSGSSCQITLADKSHSVAFTNTRNGVIPTGVIIAIAPFAIGILVFGAVLIFIVIRRKRRPY